MIRLTDICKEITDQIPFEKGLNFLILDKTLPQYLILALPFLENIIEDVLNTLLYKFQNKKEFQLNFEENLVNIIKLPDTDVLVEDMSFLISQGAGHLAQDDNRQSKSLEEQLLIDFVLDVRINIMEYKKRVIDYMRKLYKIYQENFQAPFGLESLQVIDQDHCDPFKVIWQGYTNTVCETFKLGFQSEFNIYEDNQHYGKLNSEFMNSFNIKINKKYSKSIEEIDDHDSELANQQKESEISAQDDVSRSSKDSGTDNGDTHEIEDSHHDEQTASWHQQLDILNDWLFSEEVPFFNKNEFVKGWISRPEDLELLFKIILAPMKYPLHAKAKKKYSKLTQNLNIELKATYPVNSHFVYNPEKHNGYYLRARRMMIIFLFKPNINTLMAANKNFVDVFYKTLQEEVWDNSKTKVNMDWVFKLIQYFLLIDISGSLKNIVKYHLPYYLLGNIEVTSAKITLTSLITPGDLFFKIPKKMLNCLYGYLSRTTFFAFYVKLLLDFNQKEIEKKINNLKGTFSDYDLEEFDEFESGGTKNPILNLYHSFFNVKQLLKNHKQPEDYSTQKTNIDNIDWESQAQYKKRKRFSKFFSNVVDEENAPKKERGEKRLTAPVKKDRVCSQTFNRIDSITEDYHNPLSKLLTNFKAMGVNLENIERQKPPQNTSVDKGNDNIFNCSSLVHIEEEMENNEDSDIFDINKGTGILEKIIASLQKCGRFKFKKMRKLNIPLTSMKATPLVLKIKKIARGIIVCRRLLVVGKRANRAATLKKKGSSLFNNFTLQVYKEKIKISTDFEKVLHNQDSLFLTYMKNEHTAVHLAEVLDIVVTQCINNIKPNFGEILNLPKRNCHMLFDIISANKNFLVNQFECYMTKINFALENKTMFQSAYICGSMINNMLLNQDELMVNPQIRQQSMNYIRNHLALICYYITKSHRIYRMKQKDVTIKQPGHITIVPLSDLRILICTTLFNFIGTDHESGFNLLNHIHDSTYHVLFMFAMEKCHNNIFLAKFLSFQRLLFRNANDLTLLNAVIKINLLSDLSNFFLHFVHSDILPRPPKELFMFFFKELAQLIEEAADVIFLVD